MNLSGPSAAGLANGLGAVFLEPAVPSGGTFTIVLSKATASILKWILLPSVRGNRASLGFIRTGPAQPPFRQQRVRTLRRQGFNTGAEGGCVKQTPVAICARHLHREYVSAVARLTRRCVRFVADGTMQLARGCPARNSRV
jgi:hypothetical protein